MKPDAMHDPASPQVGQISLDLQGVETELSNLMGSPDAQAGVRRSRTVVIKPGASRPRIWPYAFAVAAIAGAGALVGVFIDDLSGRSDYSALASASAPVVVQPTSAALQPQAAPANLDASPPITIASKPAQTAPSPRSAEPAKAPRERPRRQEARNTRRATAKEASCAGLSGAAAQRCAYPKLLAADRRLRRAYEGAVEAKAPRQELVSYQRRWSRLRRDARRDPERVALAYDDLALELSQAARERR